MLPLCQAFLDDESGATGTEYILIAAIVTFAAFTAFSILDANLIGTGVSEARELMVVLGGWASG